MGPLHLDYDATLRLALGPGTCACSHLARASGGASPPPIGRAIPRYPTAVRFNPYIRVRESKNLAVDKSKE